MTKSQAKNNEPFMGRADVLLRFLQLISKDRPQDLDAYLTDLDEDTERRPLVNQIVDRIISGDKKLYEQYAQARREVGSRNPYQSVEDPVAQNEQEQAVGYFLSKWIAFENMVKQKAEQTMIVKPTNLYSHKTEQLLNFLEVSDEMKTQTWRLRALRNLVVHGVDRVDESELRQAGNLLEKLTQELRKKHP